MTLTEFLLARIAEDEAAARTRFVSRRMVGGEMREIPVPLARGAWAWSPARALAECEAKRRIVELGDDGTVSETPSGLIAWVLKELAQVYADHADYLPEWRP